MRVLLVARYPVSIPPESIVPELITTFPVRVYDVLVLVGVSFTQAIELIVTVVTADRRLPISRARYVNVIGLGVQKLVAGVNRTTVPEIDTIHPVPG